MQLRGLESRIGEDVIQFNGELLIYILYQGNEEDERLQWLETTVPLQGEVDCSGCPGAVSLLCERGRCLFRYGSQAGL